MVLAPEPVPARIHEALTRIRYSEPPCHHTEIAPEGSMPRTGIVSEASDPYKDLTSEPPIKGVTMDKHTRQSATRGSCVFTKKIQKNFFFQNLDTTNYKKKESCF